MEPSLVQFFQKDHNFLLLATAVASGGMLLWPLLRRSTGGPSVSTAQATQLINRDDALIVDVREPAEYQAGHILGAKNTPLERLGETELKRKDKPVIVYCESGERAPKAAAILRKRGYDRVLSLQGGLGAWKQAGLPVEK
ncbi:MAG TPA: rhodanese-like domain-containing protein [Burkholderiales bacterium]|nr:rhodanese-like domain-containing protein [Burkholderiales bacterium]